MTDNLEHSWLAKAKKLAAIASTGLHFGESEFAHERYHEIHGIASAMLADLGEVSIKKIENLLGPTGTGYETPRVDVRGAVFRAGKILLVKEKLDGLWTLPGGYADVGISAADNIVKEVEEEANIAVRAGKLFAVVHKAAHEYDMDIRDFYKFYFLCEQKGDAEPTTGPETTAVGFFSLDNLPPLSTGRVIEKHIRLAAEHLNNPTLPTYFD
jgi:ADP-ribose pyrophosphatase YjhB (NUDIX family)